MNRRLPAIVVVCLLTSASAYARTYSKAQEFRAATPAELQMTSLPSAPGAEAAILDWVRVDDDRESTSSEYFRIKVFSEEGKKHADVELTYMPAYPIYGRITNVEARTIRPDGTIVPFNGKIYEKTVVKVGRRTLKAKTFSLADVQPGSIIEYRYVLRWVDNLLFNTHWSVQKDIPVLHSHFTLYPYAEGDIGSFFTFMGLPQGVSPQKVGRDRFELELRDMPALDVEAFAPPEEQLRARVNFFYTYDTGKPEDFWPKQAKVFAKDIEQFIGRSKSAEAVAKKLTAEEADRGKLLRKIYAHAQSLRNLSFESMKTEQEIKRQDISEAKNVEEVLRKGAGFSHEINRAFVSIARAAGFEADAVRVAPRDKFFFTEKFPDADQMNGEVAVVSVDGKPLYLDPGTPLAPFSIVSWEKTNVKAIQVSKGATPAWGSVPSHDPLQAVRHRKADLRLNDENLEGTITVTYSGQEALVRRLRGITEDEASRTKSIEDEVKGWFPDGATLTLKSLTGVDSADDKIVATYDVVLPNVVSRAGSRTVVPLSVFETKATNPFAPTTRTNLIYFPYPSTEQDEVKLTLPATLDAPTLPSPVDLNAGALKYKAQATKNGKEITFNRTAHVNVTFVDPKHYTSLRNFFNHVTTAEQQPLVLVASTAAAGSK